MGKEKAKPIFINYRTALSAKEASWLYLMLNGRFPGEVFLDAPSVKGGTVGETAMEEAVKHCKAFLCLIPPDWAIYPIAPEKFAKNRKSILRSDLHSEEKDYVRGEIEIALQTQGVAILPILLNGAELPLREDLPLSIQTLFDYQSANERRPLNFNQPIIGEFEALFDRISELIGIAPQKTEGGDNLFHASLKVEFPLPQEFYKFLPARNTPFVGLKPFRREDARLFFGRSREIFDLCFKLFRQEEPWIFLLDGYSGTGKSSLLQAGIIPRIEAQGWACAYGRREEDKIRGLKGVFGKLLDELLKSGNQKGVCILDQLEEAVTDPIAGLGNELPEFGVALEKAILDYPHLKFILGFRSEQATRIKKVLDDLGLIYDDQNTLFPLDRTGAIEAVSGVTGDAGLQKKYKLEFRPQNLPEQIVQRFLLKGRENYHIAPLLQVNMELLWERRLHNGAVVITQHELQNIIDHQEGLLDHYMKKVREQISEGIADDFKVLQLMNAYVQDEPASSTCLDKALFGQETFGQEEPLFRRLQKELKDQYLLAEINTDDQPGARLAHDVLAKVIRDKYLAELKKKKDISTQGYFDSLKRDFLQQMDQVQFLEASTTLEKLFELRVRREELRPLMMEMTFIWNETNFDANFTGMWLKYWLDSGLLSESQKAEGKTLPFPPDKKVARAWLEKIAPNPYADLQKKYLAPPDTVMVEIPGGRLQIGEGAAERLAEVSSFRMANIPVTWAMYGLYLYATDQQKMLSERAPSWGINAGHPVVNVSWYDAIEYCNWLSGASGLQPAYAIDKSRKDPNNLNKNDELKWVVTPHPQSNGYRLPTEAEWEYAARGGANTNGFVFAGSNYLGEVGWYTENANSKTHPVGEKAPNELGLRDLSGNVREWCRDWYGDYPAPLPKDYAGASEGSGRVLRGGSWFVDDSSCRVAFRDGLNPKYRYKYIGFRLAQGS